MTFVVVISRSTHVFLFHQQNHLCRSEACLHRASSRVVNLWRQSPVVLLTGVPNACVCWALYYTPSPEIAAAHSTPRQTTCVTTHSIRLLLQYYRSKKSLARAARLAEWLAISPTGNGGQTSWLAESSLPAKSW